MIERLFQSLRFFWGVVLVGLLGVGFTSIAIQKSFQRSYVQEGEGEFNRAFGLLKERVDVYIYGLQGMAGIYLVSDFHPSRLQVRRYAQFRKFFSNFYGSLGFGFIRFVHRKDLVRYLQRIRQDQPSFQIKEIGDIESKELMIIETIEPIEGNETALGVDIGSDENRRWAAVKSMESGLPILTHAVKLVQLNQKEIGFLYLLPLYRSSYTPLTMEERAKEIIGWSYTPIVASELERSLLSRTSPLLTLAVFEKMSDGSMKKIFGDILSSSVDYQRILEIGGQSWLVQGKFDKPVEYGLIKSSAWLLFIFLGGLYTGLCLFIRRLVVAASSNGGNLPFRK